MLQGTRGVRCLLRLSPTFPQDAAGLMGGSLAQGTQSLSQWPHPLLAQTETRDHWRGAGLEDTLGALDLAVPALDLAVDLDLQAHWEELPGVLLLGPPSHSPTLKPAAAQEAQTL